MRLISTILMTLTITIFGCSIVFAEEMNPKVSKYDTDMLFDEDKEFERRKLIVKFNSSVSQDYKEQILQSLNIKEVSSLGRGGFSLVSAGANNDLASIAESLLKFKHVEYVEPNYEVESAYTPLDPYYGKQWYLRKLQMPQAWNLSKGTSNVTVAVIDSGVQISHPELSGKIVFPYDMISRSSNIYADEHGTHVAGIIGAAMNNIGISGMAPNVKIMPVNVFQGDVANIFDIVDGIYYAVDHKADIINLSLGSTTYSYALDYAVNYAASKGVIIVAAAGNDNNSEYTYPAALPSVIGVSATDMNDQIAEFSNYGDFIDFAAPGVDIYSTNTGNSYGSLNGTSMAAPIVSGVGALVLSKNPFMNPTQLENILRKSSVDLGDKGWDVLYGNGRVDPLAALNNTPYPLHSLSITDSSFIMNGKNNTEISFYAYGGTTISLYVKNTKGEIVKKLIPEKKWSGGKAAAFWNGKKDNGEYAVSGDYKILVKVSNGKKAIYRSMNMKIIDKVIPAIRVASTVNFTTLSKGQVVLPFEVNKSGKVKAVIYDHRNREIKRVLNNRSVSSGIKSLSWDGKTTKGKFVSDGKYKLVMSMIDSNKVKSSNRTVTVIVDTTKPTGKVGLYSPLVKMDTTAKPIAKLEFKEDVYVSAYVTTDKGIRVKKLTAEKLYHRGNSILAWDGKNDRGVFAGIGKYLISIKFRDSLGNGATMKSSVFTLK